MFIRLHFHPSNSEIYFNADQIVAIVPDPQDGGTRLFAVGDEPGCPWLISESAEEILAKITKETPSK